MNRSHRLKRYQQLDIRLSATQQANILYAEANGLTFFLDFGYETTREQIEQQIFIKQIKEAKKCKAMQ